MAVEASANALLTVAEYRLLANISDSDTAFSLDRCQFLVNGASGEVERYCNRKFISPSAAIAEVFSGDGEKNYFVQNLRIADGNTPTLAYWDGDSWESAVSPSYVFTFNSEKGLIYFTDGNVFTKGLNNWRVTYLYGWTIASIPADLKRACATMVQRELKKLDGAEGLNSQNFTDNTTSYNLSAWTPEIRETLNRYRRLTCG